jgi:hypothetical protein
MASLKVKRDFYINIIEQLAPKTKIDTLAWVLLYRKYGTDIFYLFNLMAGLNIKMPSHRTIIDVIKKVKETKINSEYLEIPLDEQ